VAEHVHRVAASHNKRVQALGGAKNHLVVMPDADLDAVADALMSSAFGSAGERCMAVSVAVAVGKQTADALVSKLCPCMAALRVGPGDAENVEMGPLVTQEHLNRVVSYIASGMEERARLVFDGRETTVPARGYFIGPTLFSDVRRDMRIYREEIFGPVLGIVVVDSLDEAIDLVNAHEYGNGAVIYTESGGAAQRFNALVAAGMIGINVPIPVPMAFYSFGGWKNSLFGDHAIHGMEGVRFFTRLKTTTACWSKASSGGFAMPVMT